MIPLVSAPLLWDTTACLAGVLGSFSVRAVKKGCWSQCLLFDSPGCWVLVSIQQLVIPQILLL